MSFDTPVALIAYRRPDLTQLVFDRIAEKKPARLFLITDAPTDPSEKIACEAVRNIISRVDWPCKVSTNFAASHLGCARRVASGLDWVFTKTDRAVILEDDCLPLPGFFAFCQEKLDRFQEDHSVMHIGGCNILPSGISCEGDYFFSRFCLPPWGWATWSRAWQHYQFDMRFWRENRSFAHEFIREQHWEVWDALLKGNAERLFTWDLQWNLDLWRVGGRSVLPSKALVTNIGFRADATHTRCPRRLEQCSSTFRETSSLGKVFSQPLEIDREWELALARIIHSCLKQ